MVGLIILCALAIALLAPWARYYVLTTQIATLNLRKSRNLAEAEFEEVVDLRSKVEFLYGKYVNSEAARTRLTAHRKADQERITSLEKELKDKAEALVHTERLVGLNPTKDSDDTEG